MNENVNNRLDGCSRLTEGLYSCALEDRRSIRDGTSAGLISNDFI